MQNTKPYIVIGHKVFLEQGIYYCIVILFPTEISFT